MESIDQLLTTHKVNVQRRKTLSSDTMHVIHDIKRIRFVRTMLQIVCGIGMVLFTMKWLENEILYLVKIFITNHFTIRTQLFLYIEALIESLPKLQLFTVLLACILWLSWKRFETFLQTIRITSKKTISMKILSMTPRLVIINSLFITALLGFSGYTYAEKTEQKKLKILKQHINQTGRVEFATNCSSDNPQLTNFYEVKKGATISPEDSKHILSASCYYEQSEELAREKSKEIHEKYSNAYTAETYTGGERKEVHISDVYKIVKKSPEAVELISSYDEKTMMVDVNKGAKVYQGDTLLSIDTLYEGQIIRPVILETNIITDILYKNGGMGTNYETKKKEIILVIVLPEEPTIKWYNYSLLNMVTRVKTCTGNPQDRCNSTASIDLFPTGGGEAVVTQPRFIPFNEEKEKILSKEISGTITEFDATSIKLKSSSGRIFTILLDTDIITDFNNNRAAYYQNRTIEKGDSLLVTYFEEATKHDTTITKDQLFTIVLNIEVIKKTDDIQKY